MEFSVKCSIYYKVGYFGIEVIKEMKYLYMRASTTENKQSLARQEKFGRDNNVPESNWFREYASGAKNDRVELNRLLSMLKENDELYCIEASRLTRSMKFLLELLDFAKEKKIKLVMGDFILDCTGTLSVLTQGQIMMLGLLNEMQRLMIVEAVNEGLAAARERNGGKNPGGQPKLDKERLYEKCPDFLKFYVMYKNKQLTMVQLSKLCGVSRNTAYSYVRLVEKKEHEN